MTTATLTTAGKDTSATPAASHTSAPAARAMPQPVFAAVIPIQRKCACGGGCPDCQARKEDEGLRIQPKLAVSRPGDEYEQEADRAADRVVSAVPHPGRAPQAAGVPHVTPLVHGRIQRKVATEAFDSAPSRESRPSRGRAPPSLSLEPAHHEGLACLYALQRKCACGGSVSDCHCDDEEELAQRKPAAPGSASARPLATDVLPHHLGSGQPLDRSTRSFMESGFGSDFSNVRVHTGPRAASAARAVNALAYTVGHDIVFAHGQYSPDTTEGRKLLAHELTHVLQQSAGLAPAAGGALLQRQPALSSDEPECEDAPRHLGDVKPEIACDKPTIDLTQQSGSPQLQHFHFCLDSDVLLGSSAQTLAKFAGQQAANTTFVVHGFASTDGPADYNKRLSCHRAQRVAHELVNAGVRSEQIREVSGLGETEAFSFGEPSLKEANRVVVVFAENGRVQPFTDDKRPADTNAQKQAVLDVARDRLLAGQYDLAADFYISFWTCGHMPTVRHAVDRLRVALPKDDDNETLPEKANGIEEDSNVGVNGARISNVALRADNPITCTMGRLVDMAFHHAVKGDTSIPTALSDPEDQTLRHAAGRHLAALAGLGACTGAARPRTVGVRQAGVEEPLDDDPLAALTPPACARTAQPTRMPAPDKAARHRPTPGFVTSEVNFKPTESGVLTTTSGKPARAVTSQEVLHVSANAGVVGKPEQFQEYEFGFIQTVVDDLMIAEYVSGRLVVQRLPVPIRAAGIRGTPPVPAPWMDPSAVKRPDAKGLVELDAGWRMHTDFATALSLLRPSVSGEILDTWQRRTSVAVWLVARRVGAFLDRFSLTVLDGRTYDITQNLDFDVRRVPGDLLKGTTPQPGDPAPGGEGEVFRATGAFQAFETSAEPADMRTAQLGGASTADIDLPRQVTRILEPSALGKDEGLTRDEYIAVVRRILDTPEILDPTGARAAPRLGFVFDDLTITLTFNRATGRILPVSNLVDPRTGAVNPVKVAASVNVDSPGVGRVALNHLALALGLRLQKRDFLGESRAAALRTADIPASGVLEFTLAALSPDQEPQMLRQQAILRDMAEMWACSEITVKDPRFIIGKEFAATYWLDRNAVIHRLPTAGFFTSRSDGEALTTNVLCGNPAGAALGTAHSHPEDSGDGPNPSPSADIPLAKSRRCGRQHFIVSKDVVVAYFPNGSRREIGRREDVLPRGVKCSQSIPVDQEIL